MYRTALVLWGASFAMTLFSRAVAEGWTPPEKPDPTNILQEAKADARTGNYADALAKHVWFHEHALEIESAQYGVRLSFALSYWIALGDDYPEAQKRFIEIRDAAGKAVLEKNNPREPFHDFQSMSQYLGEEQKTVELFLEFEKKHPSAAADLYDLAKDNLIKEKRYEICSKYLDPDNELETITTLFRETTKMAKGQQNVMLTSFAERSLTQEGGNLVALLAVTGKKDKATEIATSLKKLRDDVAFHQTIDAAMTGEFPSSLP